MGLIERAVPNGQLDVLTPIRRCGVAAGEQQLPEWHRVRLAGERLELRHDANGVRFARPHEVGRFGLLGRRVEFLFGHEVLGLGCQVTRAPGLKPVVNRTGDESGCEHREDQHRNNDEPAFALCLLQFKCWFEDLLHCSSQVVSSGQPRRNQSGLNDRETRMSKDRSWMMRVHPCRFIVQKIAQIDTPFMHSDSESTLAGSPNVEPSIVHFWQEGKRGRVVRRVPVGCALLLLRAKCLRRRGRSPTAAGVQSKKLAGRFQATRPCSRRCGRGVSALESPCLW